MINELADYMFKSAVELGIPDFMTKIASSDENRLTDWLWVYFFMLNVAVNGFGTDRSKTVPLFQFFIGAWVVGVVSYLAFVMSVFVHHSPSSGA